jgi:phage head maturation protease
LIKRGDIDGSSFAFTVAEADEEWDESEVKKGKLPLRTINRISKLYDVSPATYPAYPTTSVSVRSRAKASAERRDALVEPRMALADEPKAPDIVAREQARAAVEEAKAWRR